jgi:FkbM family methyltransferase
MNLKALASHTVDLDLLPEAPMVLDVGCRWFDFTKELIACRPAAHIVAMDPARDVLEEARVGDPWLRFINAALVAPGQPSRQRLAHYSTGEGDFLTTLSSYYGAEIYDVDCITLADVMRQYDVPKFDVIKLDCEGSEFGILESWPGAIATQISVEFHDWDKPRYRTEVYYDSLLKRLPWYKFMQHEFSRQGTGVGHWDSLLVLNNGK